MMAYVLPIGILGMLAIAACWALAIWLYRVGRRGSVAHKLALLLVIEGFVLATAGFPEFALGLLHFAFPDWYWTLSSVAHHTADVLLIALYPPFLAAALKTPLTRPFGRKGVRILLAVVALALVIGSVVSSARFGSEVGSSAIYVAMMVLFIFALVASLDAWRSAPDRGNARVRARAFAIAFGLRDICWGFVYGASFYMVYTQSFSIESDLFWIVKAVYALGTLLAVPLIAYGILRAHLFDIDLRIKWTIKQSTVAALIISFVFLVSEGASTFLADELGPVMGLLAAAVLIFFLTPLQQFAERVAARAMPGTENTPEYIAFRKMQVYENALIEALAEEGISPKERALLNHLRNSLEISEADAKAIEADVANRAAGMQGATLSQQPG